MHKLTKSIQKEIKALSKKLPKQHDYIKEKKYRTAKDIRAGVVKHVWFDGENKDKIKERVFEIPETHKEAFSLKNDKDLCPVLNIGIVEVNHKNKMKKAFKKTGKKGILMYLEPFLNEEENKQLKKQL